MATRVWLTGVALLMFYGRLTCAKPVNDSLSEVCSKISFADSVLKFENSFCPADCVGGESGVTEVNQNLFFFLNCFYRVLYEFLSAGCFTCACPLCDLREPN